MARSQQSYGKRQKEKDRLKKREEKQKKKEARREESKSKEEAIPFAYVDKYGNLTDTPPESTPEEDIIASEIVLGIPKKEESNEVFNPIREGKVSFFDHSKGFGFIIDIETQEKHFCHISRLNDDISEQNVVSFELEKGPRGMNAVNVSLKE